MRYYWIYKENFIFNLIIALLYDGEIEPPSNAKILFTNQTTVKFTLDEPGVANSSYSVRYSLAYTDDGVENYRIARYYDVDEVPGGKIIMTIWNLGKLCWKP